jgi:hypothetical protein
MSRWRQDAGDAVWAATLSLGLHLALSLFCLSFIEAPPEAAAPVPAARERSQIAIEVELELPQASTALRLPDVLAVPLPTEPLSGGDLLPRPDTKRAGLGGSDEVEAPAVNLAPRDDEAHLVPAIRSRIDRAQVARTHTGPRRRSPEDDRVGRQPTMLTFVADGNGRRQEQRPAARFDPSGGGWRAALPARAAAAIGTQAQPLWGARTLAVAPKAGRAMARDGVAAQPLGGASDGSRVGSSVGSSVGSGVMDRAAGSDSRVSADVARARPQTIDGPESSPTNLRGDQQDDVDSEQEVVSQSPALLRASTAGGEQGAGPGGQRGEYEELANEPTLLRRFSGHAR